MTKRETRWSREDRSKSDHRTTKDDIAKRWVENEDGSEQKQRRSDTSARTSAGDFAGPLLGILHQQLGGSTLLNIRTDRGIWLNIRSPRTTRVA
jgi:hypothetical protein